MILRMEGHVDLRLYMDARQTQDSDAHMSGHTDLRLCKDGQTRNSSALDLAQESLDLLPLNQISDD